jgi:hypothetical protein
MKTVLAESCGMLARAKRWVPSMKVSIALMDVATELAAASRARQRQTNDEIEDLEAQLRQLTEQRDGQIDARKRLDAYQPKVGTDYLCPNCWVKDGRRSPLTPIPFERADEDIMRCHTCGRDFGISLRD